MPRTVVFRQLQGDGAASACLYLFNLLAVDDEDLRRLLVERGTKKAGMLLFPLARAAS